ncbi:hypothetical protein M426DRAFT_74941 [Hypoxylon sp. CI-4A]|nr:hypothetical protein M426DRAFT_74941 [Hypoxylon sp. CI-4A]
MASLPYEEPSILEILTLSSFLLVLNLTNAVLDRALYCGLVGQVLAGVAWGALLSPALQTAVVQLGYLGLVLTVFEGGASTSVDAARRNLALSAAVAVTGVAGPVALSFAVLGGLAGGSSRQCFAAGAALCSTSLGTTLGCVLGSAAMMDDVVGLVVVQIVAGLGTRGGGGIDVRNVVVRPVLVSAAFAVLVPLGCWVGVRVFGSWLGGRKVQRWWCLDAKQSGFVVQTLLLVALVAAASYAGASVLLAAYLAGIVVSWWASSERLKTEEASSTGPQTEESTAEPTTVVQNQESSQGDDDPTTSESITRDRQEASRTGSDIYEIYYAQAVTRVLKPFFFASVGFSIPISDMFSGEVVWRGIIYSVLMAIGKILCGLWLVRFSVPTGALAERFGSFVSAVYRVISFVFQRLGKSVRSTPATKETAAEGSRLGASTVSSSQAVARSDSTNNEGTQHATLAPAKPLSLYPAAIISSAMVARGEIGFLISAVAESNGVFRRSSDTDGAASELFLVVTWAIVVCTIIGPICVGILVKRVRRLEGNSSRARDVLGVWGVE